MCQIQFTSFNVNGSANIPNCTAKTTDQITIELGATFLSNELGEWIAHVAVSNNNGPENYYSARNNVIVGTNVFKVSIPSTLGTIKVTEVNIINPISGELCGGNVIHNPTMTNCQILTVISAVGSINFESNPVGAEIFLDDVDQQKLTPFTITDIPAGDHSYKLTLADHTDITGTVTVLENQTVTVSADFTTGQVNVFTVVLGVVIAAALIGGLIYALNKK